MMQEVGETADAYMSELAKLVDETIRVNGDRTDPYYIWIAHKPMKIKDAYGRFMIKQHYKVYKDRPPSMMGTIIVKVDNRAGKTEWEINPPDVPFNYEALGCKKDKAVPLDTPIKNLYIYN